MSRMALLAGYLSEVCNIDKTIVVHSFRQRNDMHGPTGTTLSDDSAKLLELRLRSERRPACRRIPFADERLGNANGLYFGDPPRPELRRFVQRHTVAFRILEVGDEPVLADVGSRDERFAAGFLNGGQCGVDLFDVQVDHGPFA